MTLEKLKDLLMSLYTELQDVKSNQDDDEMLDLLNFMDSELVDAGKIVGQLKDFEAIIKAAIRSCDHNLHLLKKYHKVEFPKEKLENMKDLLRGKKDLVEFNAWLDRCKEIQDQ